ncbi:MAG: 4Fe-4S dicluster domain-containing protein [archaeon]
MPVLINFKICDNSEDCGGIGACPTGAFYWDEAEKKIKIDDSKCNDCGVCEPACPVGAIRVAKSKAEYEKIKKELEKDPRNVSDLFVDRYGAMPIHKGFIIDQDRFEVQIIRSTKPAVVELFKDDTIECLLHSIPLKELFKDQDIKYRKINVKDDSLLKKYSVKELPALLFFTNGKLVGKIEGYFDDKRKDELKEKIVNINSQ